MQLAGGAEEAGQFGAMHFAESAAHEAAFLRGDQHRFAG